MQSLILVVPMIDERMPTIPLLWSQERILVGTERLWGEVIKNNALWNDDTQCCSQKEAISKTLQPIHMMFFITVRDVCSSRKTREPGKIKYVHTVEHE